jgi:adenine-specific DNA-methyltransferase
MALIDALLDKITDAALRQALREQVEVLLQKQSYGLVFQQHEPETVELPGYKVRRGAKVRIISEDDGALYRVDVVKGSTASVMSMKDPPEYWDVALDDLVVVREFGDPVYPGLRNTGQVHRGGDKSPHLVINAENFHALETLLYTHEGKIDAVYIDPPYNTRDRDWKYNNDYVDPEDDYAHSLWLAFMERRLKVAQRLLNPEDSVLIVTIDEKEVFRLGILLEQTFPEAASIQMVTSVISAKGAVRRGRFSRVEEHIFFVAFGSARIQPWTSNMLPSYVVQPETESTPEDASSASDGSEIDEEEPAPIEWLGLRRREPSSTRGARPNQFYPIFVRADDGRIHAIGDAVNDDVDRHTVRAPKGTIALWPLKPNGAEMLWGLTPDALRKNWSDGYVKVKWNARQRRGTVYYLPSGTIDRIRDGSITVTGRAADGSIEGHVTPDRDTVTPPKRVWSLPSHNAETGGTNVLSQLIPGRHFPYPKSLYAVEDTLRFAVANKPNAVILDFFAGSGTTLHAVARLNRQDGGRRRSILITNNEVSAAEADALAEQGHAPGEAEWEALGICEYITKPRVSAAITGKTPEGKKIRGRYRFVDPFPMADGFEENAQFFTLTYEDPDLVSIGRKFEAIAPLLWMKAGSAGVCITAPAKDWVLPADACYGVLFNTDAWRAFVDAVAERPEEISHVFVVTDSVASFQQILAEVPTGIDATQLYSDYLRTFEINTRGRGRV